MVVIGNLAMTAAMLLFGCVASYKAACLVRFCGGLLNGVTGWAPPSPSPHPSAPDAAHPENVLPGQRAHLRCARAPMRPRANKTVIGESGTAAAQAHAMMCLCIAWGLGTSIGPLIGGILSRPCGKYAWMPLCGEGELLQARRAPCCPPSVPPTIPSLTLMPSHVPS